MNILILDYYTFMYHNDVIIQTIFVDAIDTVIEETWYIPLGCWFFICFNKGHSARRYSLPVPRREQVNSHQGLDELDKLHAQE